MVIDQRPIDATPAHALAAAPLWLGDVPLLMSTNTGGSGGRLAALLSWRRAAAAVADAAAVGVVVAPRSEWCAWCQWCGIGCTMDGSRCGTAASLSSGTAVPWEIEQQQQNVRPIS